MNFTSWQIIKGALLFPVAIVYHLWLIPLTIWERMTDKAKRNTAWLCFFIWILFMAGEGIFGIITKSADSDQGHVTSNTVIDTFVVLNGKQERISFHPSERNYAIECAKQGIFIGR
jgi:hypothetical protein